MSLTLAEPTTHLRMADISRALARHDASTAYTLLREVFPEGLAGRALLELVRTEPGWPKPYDGPPEEALSPREMEVLRCADRGLSLTDTAREIICARDTVKSHRRKIMLKLGVESMPAAVFKARETGLLS